MSGYKMVRSQRFLLFSPFPSNLSGKFRPPPKTLTFGTWKSAGSKEIPSLELPHSGPRTTETVGHRKLGHGFLRCLSRDEEVAMGSSSICPIASMYGIFTYIWLIFMVNVGNIYHIWILWYIDQFSLGLGVQPICFSHVKSLETIHQDPTNPKWMRNTTF